tara:strand:- start:615 stop:941 length:327 start_codon:yes stop_codon:yes gene_type:complete
MVTIVFLVSIYETNVFVDVYDYWFCKCETIIFLFMVIVDFFPHLLLRAFIDTMFVPSSTIVIQLICRSMLVLLSIKLAIQFLLKQKAWSDISSFSLFCSLYFSVGRMP